MAPLGHSKLILYEKSALYDLFMPIKLDGLVQERRNSNGALAMSYFFLALTHLYDVSRCNSC